MRLTNVGTAPTSGALTVRDTLPATIAYVGMSGAGWSIGTSGLTPDGRTWGDLIYAAGVAPGASVSATITVGVAFAAAPSVTNTAWLSGAGDMNAANNTSSVTTPVGGLPVISVFTTVSPNGIVQPGTLLTYEVIFTNTGGVPAIDVVAQDDLPEDVVFQVGSVTSSLPSGITAAVEYSNGSGWTYTPVSGGCGAESGLDGCVRSVGWVLAQPLPAAASGTGWLRARVR